MRKFNSVNLYEGVLVDFINDAGAFSVIPDTLGEIKLTNGGTIDVSKVKPNKMYDAHIEYGYCTNNQITIYNIHSTGTIFEILAITTESEERILTETTDNFLVTEYNF